MSQKKVEDRAFCFLFLALCFFAVLSPLKSRVCLATECPGIQDGTGFNVTRPPSILQDEQQDKPKTPNALTGIWDPNRYINIDEIQPGMEAYCLTCYRGAEIEKFELDVISVVHNMGPGRNAILVQGTDERFIHTGPVGGCSGSPVYIDGRLAGALAFAWYFSKDPLYGVTPIEEMLEAGQVGRLERDAPQEGLTFDFSKPIDLAEIDKQIVAPQLSRENTLTGVSPLPCPLVTSELPAESFEQLKTWAEPMGFMVVPGINGAGQQKADGNDVSLEPGAVLTVPLVSGDITMFALGTATEIIDDRVYGFGHSFLGRGPIDWPMATGKVHTVISSLQRSFKLGSTLEIVGTLTTDESAAVLGQIGKKPKMIPLTIKVDRYNDPQKRAYNCEIVNDRLLTPVVFASAVAGAVSYLGDFPQDHMIEYKVAINTEGAEPITFENVSTDVGINEMLLQSRSSIALLMNNPYEMVNIESLDVEIRIAPTNITSHIWSVDLSDTKVEAGETIQIEVVVESFLAGKKRYHLSLAIPEDTQPGEYNLTVCGSDNYGRFLQKAAPYKFTAQNLASMIDAINNILQIRQDKLYCFLTLPPSGVAVEKAELPDLPATKALILQDAKRTLRTQPYLHWLEETVETGTIIINSEVMRITVEK